VHFEIMVEEQSMETFLRELLPRVVDENTTFDIYPFQGKHDLLRKLESRLSGYAKWLPPTWRVIVLVDRDNDDCAALKATLEQSVKNVGLLTLSVARPHQLPWQVLNRIAIEELEAWYFGDWEAVLRAYPRVSKAIPGKASYRDPDAIAGGTWEAFERILQRAGYFGNGLSKIEAAREIGKAIVIERNRSRSFRTFVAALHGAVATPAHIGN
jgi:hypothetical protein